MITVNSLISKTALVLFKFISLSLSLSLYTTQAPAHTLLAISMYCPQQPLLMCPGNQVMMVASNRRSLCGTVQCKCSYLISNQWQSVCRCGNTRSRSWAWFDMQQQQQGFYFVLSSSLMMIKYETQSDTRSRIVLTAYFSGYLVDVHVHNSWCVLGK